MISAVFFAFAQGPCAAGDNPVERLVADRAQERMNALVAGDMRAMYDLETPGLREAVTFERYRAERTGRLDVKEGRILDVSCEPEVCQVQVEMTYTYRSNGRRSVLIGPVTRVSEQRWVKSEDQWWHFYKL